MKCTLFDGLWIDEGSKEESGLTLPDDSDSLWRYDIAIQSKRYTDIQTVTEKTGPGVFVIKSKLIEQHR